MKTELARKTSKNREIVLEYNHRDKVYLVRVDKDVMFACSREQDAFSHYNSE